MRGSLCATVSLLLLIVVDGLKKRAPEPKPRVLTPDLPFIKCDVCEALAFHLVEQAGELSPAPPAQGKISSKKKRTVSRISEGDVGDILENVCLEDTKQGSWLGTYDIVTYKGVIGLRPMGGPGKCKRECQTIVQSCHDILDSIDLNDLQVAVWKETARDKLARALCDDWSESCPRVQDVKHPMQRKVNEKFVLKTEQEIQMEETLAKMAAMGMAGTVKSREDMLKQGPDGLPLEPKEEEDEHHIDNFDDLSPDQASEGGVELTYMERVWVDAAIIWGKLIALDPDMVQLVLLSLAGATVLVLILDYFFYQEDEEEKAKTTDEATAAEGAGSEAEEANDAASTAVAQE